MREEERRGERRRGAWELLKNENPHSGEWWEKNARPKAAQASEASSAG